MNRMQHVHDALRKMRVAGEAWINHEGERLRIRPLKDEEREWRAVSETGERPEGISLDTKPIFPGSAASPHGYWLPAYTAVVKTTARGGVRIGEVWWHEGRLHVDTSLTNRTRRGDDNIVLAIVVERHPRTHP